MTSAIKELDELHTSMMDDYRKLRSLLDCMAPDHAMENCPHCYQRLRTIRANMLDGAVQCDNCGDLGYTLAAEGPDQCSAQGCVASRRWASARAQRAIEAARLRASMEVCRGFFIGCACRKCVRRASGGDLDAALPNSLEKTPTGGGNA